jgi:ribosomal protein S2
MTKLTLNSLFNAKIFLGGFTKSFNPQVSGYVAGIRHNIVIMDAANSLLRIKRFILFVKRSTSRYMKTLFVLADSWISLTKTIAPLAFYAPFWIGGVLSNYSSTFFFFKKSSLTFYVPRMPDIGVFLCNAKYSHYASIEASNTRTPAAILFDSNMNPNPISYSVGGNIEYGSAKFFVKQVVLAIKAGFRLRKLSFKKTILKLTAKQFAIKKNTYLLYLQSIKNLIFNGSLLWKFEFSSRIKPFLKKFKQSFDINKVQKFLYLNTHKFNVYMLKKREKLFYVYKLIIFYTKYITIFNKLSPLTKYSSNILHKLLSKKKSIKTGKLFYRRKKPRLNAYIYTHRQSAVSKIKLQPEELTSKKNKNFSVKNYSNIK